MRLKVGVKLNGARPELLVAMVIIDGVFVAPALPDFVVTSVVDGKHSEKSSHWKGEAFDMRSRNWKPEDDSLRLVTLSKCRHRLGRDFDLVVEEDHWHCEWDPRGKP